MVARDSDEPYRVSSPLELLFDLTFVVAVAQVAAQLAHSIAAGKVLTDGIGPYLMVFFAIWWAWMNFTWFASAYDTDDVPYRLMTIVQMGGVLVLAAGVPAAFAGQDFTAITLGYLIMRVGLVGQWLRAGVEHPDGRRTAFRYAIGISVVQVGWIVRLALPHELAVPGFLVLAIADVAVPLWAERSGGTTWHPHHIAERYGLFTIILLGETVSAVTIAVQRVITSRGVSGDLVVVAIGGLILLFAFWWLYFLQPAGESLERRRDRSYVWGYGHYLLFAVIAAAGSAVEVAVEYFGQEHIEVSALEVAYSLAIPVVLFFVMLTLLDVLLATRPTIHPAAVVVTAVAVLLVPLATSLVGLHVVVAVIALLAAGLTTFTIFSGVRRGQRERAPST